MPFYRTIVDFLCFCPNFCDTVPKSIAYNNHSASDRSAPIPGEDGNINKRNIFGTLCVAFVIYSATVYTSGTDASHVPPMSDQARLGQKIYQDKNCVACHQFYGLGGYMGPDLTNIISTRGEAYAGAFIAAGTARMPNFDLSPDEVAALVAFLGFVDQTGTYPPKNYAVVWTGNVSQEDDPR